MKYIYKIFFLFVLFFLVQINVIQAADSNFILGGGANQLRIKVNAGGTWMIDRELQPGNGSWTKQFFSNSDIFSIKFGTTVYRSTAMTKTDISSVTIGNSQQVTKRFSGTHGGQPYSILLKFSYNLSNPGYLTVQAIVDATSIPTGTSISLAYGFDAYVNGCDAGAAITVPDLGYNAPTVQKDVNLTRSQVQSLRMVGGMNNRGSGSLIALFPMGKPFDRAYSAYYTSAHSYVVVNSTANLFRFGPYNVPSCSGQPWDNGIGVVYDDIPAGETTDLRTGLSFTQDLDGELDYTWNNSKNFEANLGDNINLNLRYTSYNSNLLTNVGFKVNLPGLSVRSGASQTGFNSGNFDCTQGNEYYHLTNGSINGLGVANMTVPIQVTQCGQWSIDGDAISNMTRTLPLGSPATLTVKSEVNFATTSTQSVCNGDYVDLRVQLPLGVTAAQDFNVNLTYTGDIGDFEPLPTSVTIPAGQNRALVQIQSKTSASDNKTINVTLASSDKPFIIIGTQNQLAVTVKRGSVDAIIDKIVCTDEYVPVTAFSSPIVGTTFTWENDNTAINLAARGSGNIPAFIAKNNTTSAIRATIIVTPMYGSCPGTPEQFAIIVNPKPTVDQPGSTIACEGTRYSGYTFTGSVPNTTFEWTNDNPDIGLAPSGTGNIPTFTLLNPTDNPIDATITVIPKEGSCTGDPKTFTITVNPIATVNAIADKEVCAGSNVAAINLTSPTTTATFEWTNSHPSINLDASGTGNIPAFTAINNTDNPITATITVIPRSGSCAGTPRQFKIKVYAATNAGKIEGNPFVCKGIRPLVIKGQPSTGGSGSFTYQWQQSSNNSTWTNISGATSLDYTPPILTSNTYFRRNTIDASCGTFPSNSFLIKVMATPTSLYWKSNAGDNNWNNPANWVDKNGVQLGMVPLVCTEVHIPGGASKYPSLDGTNTPQGIYGKPVCQNIVYHFGGEVAYPQNLTYEKAYVQYNWGYYNKISGITANSQPTENVDGASAPKMQRGKWYALAAPLKNMASGDFALAGYPLTWQAVYNMANPATGILENIDFSKAFATNDVNLSKTNNTIAVKVAPYNTTIGYNNQRHLESLKGVIEIPFFENKTQVPFRPGHQYDELSKKSTFFYFDTKTLKQIYSPVGQMKRSNEAYRFIFENDNNTAGTISVGGVNVKGYQQSVTVSGTSKKVMVGNPFMASINAKNFYDANATKLVSAEGYKVFSSASQTWVQYPFSATNNIGPLQAFVITLANGLNAADLLFPLEGNLALTGAQFKGSVQRSVDTNSLSVRSVDNQNQNTEYAALSTDYDSDVKKVVSKDGHDTPEAFFITSNNDYNLLQNYDDKEEHVRLGVKSSNIKDAITLEFGNVADFAAQEGVHPILEDKLLNIKHDLLKNSNYRFNQQKLDSTSQYADVNRFILRLPKSTTGINDDKENDKSIVISYVRNELSVYADYSLSRVLVYDLKGYEVHNSGDLGTSSLSYIKHLSLPHGSYIVKVSTIEGKTVTKKIIIQQ